MCEKKKLHQLKSILYDEQQALYKQATLYKRRNEELTERLLELNPFIFDADGYVLLQAKDVFSETSEKRLAITVLRAAADWGNTEYKKHKSQCDAIKSRRDTHSENIRSIKSRISYILSQIKQLRQNE